MIFITTKILNEFPFPFISSITQCNHKGKERWRWKDSPESQKKRKGSEKFLRAWKVQKMREQSYLFFEIEMKPQLFKNVKMLLFEILFCESLEHPNWDLNVITQLQVPNCNWKELKGCAYWKEFLMGGLSVNFEFVDLKNFWLWIFQVNLTYLISF